MLEVEVQSEAEADEAIAAGADVVMLDNIEGAAVVDTARRLCEKWKGKRKFCLRAAEISPRRIFMSGR